MEGQEQWAVETLLDRRVYRGNEQFLVRWKDFGPAHDSWEPTKKLIGLDEEIKALKNQDANEWTAKRQRK